MIKSVLVVALFALVAIASAQTCVEGAVHAQYVDTTFWVTVNENSSLVVEENCTTPTILLRQGFSYDFEFNLTDPETGDNVTLEIWVQGMLVFSAEGEGNATFVPAFPGYGVYTTDGGATNFTVAVYPPVTPTADPAVDVWGTVYGVQGCSAGVVPLPPSGPNYCFFGYRVQCDNISGTVMLVSYTCNLCDGANPLDPAPAGQICDLMPSHQWPADDACLNNPTGSAKFTCVPPATPSPVVPTETATVVPTHDVPTETATELPTPTPTPDVPTASANPTEEPETETATALPPSTPVAPTDAPTDAPTATTPTPTPTPTPRPPPTPTAGAEMLTASIVVVAAAIALAF